MNQKSKKTAKREGAKAKQTKTSEPITPEERRAENPADLINELSMMRGKQQGEFLKQETMPVEHARGIIRAMYERMNQLAPRICEMMLKDLINAEIVQHGAQWDESIAITKMALHLQSDSKRIEFETDFWLKHRPREEYGTGWELQQIVYTHYKYLRLGRGWLFKPPPKVQTEMREEAWRLANQESRVKEILEGKDRWAVGEEKYKALTQARYNWRRDPEIKALKEKRTLRR